MGASRTWLVSMALSAFGCEQYDPPPSGDIFGSCCGSLGTCVPAGLVPTELSSGLSQDSCGSELLCAPTGALRGEAQASCRSVGDLEGRCLPSCLPDIAQQADKLQRGSCSRGELCLPCYDPLSGEDTGACRLGTDKPRALPRTFPACCGAEPEALGRCLPRSLLVQGAAMSEDDLARLDRDRCTGRDMLCAPAAWLDPKTPPPRCRAVGDLEGRCAPSCLPDVAARADKLEQQSCREGELCLPCYDPLSGEDTGVCRLNEDAPQDRPRTFATCCGPEQAPLGRCLPRELLLRAPNVSNDALARLGSDRCPESDTLCVPDAWLDEENAASSCSAPGGLEGRCLPGCLPELAAPPDGIEQRSCRDGELCLPCYDPLTGTDTGVCRLGTDEPAAPARTFATCCGVDDAARGHCLPRETLLASSQVQESDLARLGADVCVEGDALCVPDTWLDPKGKPAICHAAGALEGRCMPSCLPDVAAQASKLAQRECVGGELCLPCTDPLTGADTGVCTLRGDSPREPARRFASCCGSEPAHGVCLPADLLSSDQRAQLPVDSCSEPDARCAPRSLLGSAGLAPTKCTVSRLGAEEPGLCLAECFVTSPLPFLLTRTGCRSDEYCVGCSSLSSELGNGCGG